MFFKNAVIANNGNENILFIEYIIFKFKYYFV